jgi:LysM repeat protein
VKSGETLGQIAKRYGTTVSSIQAANHIKNANSLRVGTTLVIPKSAVGVAQLRRDAAKPAGAKTITGKPSRRRRPRRKPVVARRLVGRNPERHRPTATTSR